MKTFTLTLVAAALLALAGVAHAAAPALLPIQGVLTDLDGVPLTATRSIRFSLHTAETGGTEQWNDTFSVAVMEGLFAAYLGSQTALPLATFRDQGTLWLEVKVESDAPMARVQLGAAGYAGYAEYCGTVPTHQHAYTELTGTLPAGALPAGVVAGAQACGVASQVVRAVDGAGTLLCSAVDWTEVANKPALVAANQTCGGTNKVTGINAGGQLLCGADQGLTGTGFAHQVAYFDTTATLAGSEIWQLADGRVMLPNGPNTITGAGPGTGLDADLLDGKHQTAFQRRAGNVLVVGKGPDAEFATIAAALASISGNTSTNPFVVLVGPGVYSERVTMKPYVDIVGAGRLVTTITATGASSPAAAATVTGATGASLRDLKVVNSGTGSPNGVALASGAFGLVLENVSLTSIGATTTYGLYQTAGSANARDTGFDARDGTSGTYGILVVSGSLTLNSSLTYVDTNNGPAIGLLFNGSTAQIYDTHLQALSDGTSAVGLNVNNLSPNVLVQGGSVLATGTAFRYGAQINGGNVRLVSTRVYGATNTVTVNEASATVRVLHSVLEGGAAVSLDGTLRCAGVSDENDTFFASTCP